MRYFFKNLGQQRQGSTVVAHLSGSAANVILLDSENFFRYSTGAPFLYEGGHYAHSPVRIEIPHDGHWFVVVDLGGYRGRVRATVEVKTAAPSPPEPRSSRGHGARARRASATRIDGNTTPASPSEPTGVATR
jgi:hypothetical protein